MSQIKFLFLLIILSFSVNNCVYGEKTFEPIENKHCAYKESPSGDKYVQTIILKFSKTQKEDLAKVEIAQTIKTNGYLKGGTGFSPRNNHADYTVKVTDESGNVLFETEIEDPLNKTLEYIQDNGELMKKQASLAEDFVAVRMNFEEAAFFLEIHHDHNLIAKVTL